MTWRTATARTSTSKVHITKVSGSRTDSEDLAKRLGPTELSTLAILLMVNKHGYGEFKWADGSHYEG